MIPDCRRLPVHFVSSRVSPCLTFFLSPCLTFLPVITQGRRIRRPTDSTRLRFGFRMLSERGGWLDVAVPASHESPTSNFRRRSTSIPAMMVRTGIRILHEGRY